MFRVLAKLRSWVSVLVLRSRFERRIEDELQFHIEERANSLIARGAPPSVAIVQARAELGDRHRWKEDARRARGVTWIDDFVNDLRGAWATVVRSWRFSVVAMLTLAIGIVTTTFAFGQINAIFFKPPFAHDPNALRVLTWTSPQRSFAGPQLSTALWDRRVSAGRHLEFFSYDAYRHLRDHASTFSSLACWSPGSLAVIAPGARLAVRTVSGNYFDVLGVRASQGRTLLPVDDELGRSPVAVLSHIAWRNGFNGRPDILGQKLLIRSVAFEIVGVMPEAFIGLDPTIAPDIMIPRSASLLVSPQQANDTSWTRSGCSFVFGRLKASPYLARLEVERLLHQFIDSLRPPEPFTLPTVRLEQSTFSSDSEAWRSSARRSLALLLGAAGVVFIVATLNTAALLLVRSRNRMQEVATRLALGGSRRRIARQLFLENAIVAVAAGIFAVGSAHTLASQLATLGATLLPRFNSLGLAIPSAFDVGVDARVLLFSWAMTCVAAVLCGLMPALWAVRVDLDGALKGRSKGFLSSPNRYHQLIVGLQTSFAMGALLVAGLLAKTAINLRNVPLGYEPSNVLFATVVPRSGAASIEQIVSTLEGTPGVEAVAVSQWPLFNNASQTRPVCSPDAGRLESVNVTPVTSNFFAVWGVELVAGRALEPGERGVVINETLARQLVGPRNPVGAVLFDGCGGDSRPIVGVAGDHRDRQRAELTPTMYISYRLDVATLPVTLSVRTRNAAETAIAVRRSISELGVDAQSDVESGIEYSLRAIRGDIAVGVVTTNLALVVLLLACIGIYSVVAFAASSRRRELALRVALGADRTAVLRVLLRVWLVPSSMGIATATVAAAYLTRWFDNLLFGLSGHDVPTMTVVASIVAVALSLAAIVPAWRAARVEPVGSLRETL